MSETSVYQLRNEEPVANPNRRRLIMIGTLYETVEVPIVLPDFSLDIRQYEDVDFFTDEEGVSAELDYWHQTAICLIKSTQDKKEFEVEIIWRESEESFDNSQKLSALISAPDLMVSFVGAKFFDSNLIDDRKFGRIVLGSTITSSKYDDSCSITLYQRRKMNLQQMRERYVVSGYELIEIHNETFTQNGFNGFISGKFIINRYPRKATIRRNVLVEDFLATLRPNQTGTLIEAARYHALVTQEKCTLVGIAKDESLFFSYGLEEISSDSHRNGYMVVPALEHGGMHASLAAFIQYMRDVNQAFYVGYVAAMKPEDEVFIDRTIGSDL